MYSDIACLGLHLRSCGEGCGADCRREDPVNVSIVTFVVVGFLLCAECRRLFKTPGQSLGLIIDNLFTHGEMKALRGHASLPVFLAAMIKYLTETA